LSRVTARKLKNFMRKMKDEGTEGFAAGPWSGDGVQASPAVDRRPRSLWPSANSIVAALALVLIITGVVGAYLSNKSKREAVIAQVDAILTEPLNNPKAGRMLDLEARLANSLTPYQKRLRDLELELTQTRAYYDERLQDLELRLVHASGPYDERLDKLENMLVSASDPYKEKLHGIEQRLVHTTNRLDELSAVMASLTSSAEAIVAANVAMMTDPPGALPLRPAVVSRDNIALPRKEPASPAVTRQASAGPAMPAVTSQTPARPASDLPGPGKTGPWVINIGSYAKESMAIRKQAAFQKKGVETEQVAARVGDKTLYRLHVAGFNSRKEASAHARTIEQQLGLKETWIKRR
jgi:cell division protein FtsN